MKRIWNLIVKTNNWSFISQNVFKNEFSKNWSLIVFCLSSWGSSRIKRTSKVNCEKLLQLKSNSSCMLQYFVILWIKKFLQFSLNLCNVWTQRRNVQFRLVFNIRHDYFTTKFISKSWMNCFGTFPSCILCYIENWLHLRSFIPEKHYGKLWAK